MTGRHSATGQTPDLAWRKSWDDLVHGFRALGAGDEVSSTAICGHVAATSSLTTDDARTCMACALIAGQQLADHHDEHGTGGRLID